MSDERGEREKLQEFFAEVHAGDIPPPFKKLIRSRARRQPLVWKWATAAALGFALLGGWALRDLVSETPFAAPPASSAELALARSLSKAETPLDFLLVTPGSDLLGAPPRLTGDWDHLPRIDSEHVSERKERI